MQNRVPALWQKDMSRTIRTYLTLVLMTPGRHRSRRTTFSIPVRNPHMPHNDDFTVRVRSIGGEWQDLFEYKVQVDMDRVQDASMVQFDMDEPVEVMVKKNNGNFSDVKIRPLRTGNIAQPLRRRDSFPTRQARNTCRWNSTATACTICTCSPTPWKARYIRNPMTR